jgi:hypothetical protein
MNKFIRNNFLAICITLAVIFAFAKKATIFQQDKPQPPKSTIVPINHESDAVFQKYWKSQQIEQVTFSLYQDSLMVGEASLSFNLKDFGKDQPNGVIPSIACNFTKKINQANYDYSEITNSITPLNTSVYPHAVAIVSSSQANGVTDFSSFQPQPKSYLFVSRNSIEPEKEVREVSEKIHLEDEIWAKIRMNPDALPVGEFEMIPSLGYWNKTHESPNAQEVKAELKDVGNDKKLKIYSLDYPDLKRKLEIVFGANSPYRIIEFTETLEGKATKAILKINKNLFTSN